MSCEFIFQHDGYQVHNTQSIVNRLDPNYTKCSQILKFSSVARRLSSIFVFMQKLKIPPQLQYVATLPCNLLLTTRYVALFSVINIHQFNGKLLVQSQRFMLTRYKQVILETFSIS